MLIDEMKLATALNILGINLDNTKDIYNQLKDYDINLVDSSLSSKDLVKCILPYK